MICGGERTEPAYLKGLRNSIDSRSVDVKVLSKGRAPVQVVNYAIARDGPDFDEVWCILDVDQFDLTEATRLARDNHVHLAVSNPCFELWLLLHHTDCRSHCAGYSEVTRLLRKYVPAYNKTRLDYADYAPGLDDAVMRAKDLEPTGVDYRQNPSTGVWRIAERILDAV